MYSEMNVLVFKLLGSGKKDSKFIYSVEMQNFHFHQTNTFHTEMIFQVLGTELNRLT